MEPEIFVISPKRALTSQAEAQADGHEPFKRYRYYVTLQFIEPTGQFSCMIQKTSLADALRFS